VPRTRLIKSIIDALPTPEKDIVYWDETLPGFGFKITPKGRKVFIVLYRAGGSGSRLRKYTIGPYGRITLHNARLEAQRVLAARLDGRDLATEKREARRRVTVDTVAEIVAFYAKQHLSKRRSGRVMTRILQARTRRALGFPVGSRDLQAGHHRPHHSRCRPRSPDECKSHAQSDEGILQLVCRPSDPGALTVRRN